MRYIEYFIPRVLLIYFAIQINKNSKTEYNYTAHTRIKSLKTCKKIKTLRAQTRHFKLFMNLLVKIYQ